MYAVAHGNMEMSPRRRSHDAWFETDMDDQLHLPFLLPGSWNPQRGSLKAQQMLGLVTDFRNASEKIHQTSISRARSRSEERPLLSQPTSDLTEHEQFQAIATPMTAHIVSAQREGGRATLMPPPLGGFRGSGYINFSRPLSQATQLTAVPQPSPRVLAKTHLHQKLESSNQRITRDDIGLPRTPSVANTLALAKPIFERVAEVGQEQVTNEPRHHRRRRSRWASLPICLVRLGKGRVSEDGEQHVDKKDERREAKLPLTEDNLRQYEHEVGWEPRALKHDILPTPLQSPFTKCNSSLLPNISIGAEAYEKPLPTPPSSPSSEYAEGIPSMPLEKAHFDTSLPAPSITSFRLSSLVNYYTELSVCEVCRESKAASAFPVRQCTTTCTHPPHTCIGCIETWIASCIKSKTWDQCVCPECNEPMAYEDVKFFATEEVFSRYDDMAARAALSQMPTFYWCLSPHCSSGQVHPYSLSFHPTFVCVSCNHTYCLNHPSTPYHSGLSCPEYEALLTIESPSSSTKELLQKKHMQESADEKMAKQIGKRCPNAFCGWWIEKNEGCDHMTCWKCRFEFCWECCAPFEPIIRKGNRCHRKECKYYG